MHRINKQIVSWICKFIKFGKYSIKGDVADKYITAHQLRKLPYKIQRARIVEWTNALQLRCPYCEAIQINSTAMHVMLAPPDYWRCEICGRVMGVLQCEWYYV